MSRRRVDAPTRQVRSPLMPSGDLDHLAVATQQALLEIRTSELVAEHLMHTLIESMRKPDLPDHRKAVIVDQVRKTLSAIETTLDAVVERASLPKASDRPARVNESLATIRERAQVAALRCREQQVHLRQVVS